MLSWSLVAKLEEVNLFHLGSRKQVKNDKLPRAGIALNIVMAELFELLNNLVLVRFGISEGNAKLNKRLAGFVVIALNGADFLNVIKARDLFFNSCGIDIVAGNAFTAMVAISMMILFLRPEKTRCPSSSR